MTTTPTLRDAAQAAKDALSVAESLLAQDKSYHHAQVLKAYNDLAAALAAPADALAEPVGMVRTWHKDGVQHLTWRTGMDGCDSLPDGDHLLYAAPPATQLQQAVARAIEECAVICERAVDSIWEYHEENHKRTGRNVCTNLAAAIRAKGTHD